MTPRGLSGGVWAVGAGALAALPLTAWWLMLPGATTLAPPEPVGIGAAFAAAVARAAAPEEAVKLLALVLLARFKGRGWLAPRAVLASGMLLGLGFAAAETVLYAVRGGWELTAVRMLTAVPCHVCLGGVMAHYLARFQAGDGRRWLGKAWLVPLGLHGLYDFPLMESSSPEASDAVAALVLSSLVLLLLVAWTRQLLTYNGAAQASLSRLPPE